MSSSIFEDLEKERRIEEREREDERQMHEAQERKRDDSPEIIYESNWHQGFASECKEYLGTDIDHRFYYALEIGNADDFAWLGPYETRGEAEEELAAAYDRWEERVSKR